MIEIYFEQTTDAEKLFAVFTAYKNEPSLCFTYDGDKRITIHIDKKAMEMIQTTVIPAMTQFMFRFIEDRLLLSIISNDFYYKNVEEQQQILQLAHSFIDGERYDYRNGKQQAESRETFIKQALTEFLSDDISFSFESFLYFRLKNYKERLLHYVELAIDEYKLEQEYQNFIQTLRDCLVSRPAKLSIIHLLHQESTFTFYDEYFCEISAKELRKLIDRTLIVNQPMYIDSSVLAPLVSIAPKTIYLYTGNSDDGMVQTIQNLFQERLKLYDLDFFLQSKQAYCKKIR
ncbi:putative sporulation protein YtxC [Anoxybacillus vitaminiphilus]|uniref:Putative sporulation protein YtxC n=1 Tax=Paranoxybacillus vitaminiphilus TaxID=581036 RepID=A0A327YK03_9BACL|nr:putative sporulation protein YtxC [Anoxybacillus vitaminiphilus]RAK21280.1 putative sporulation protein YtxC [Anoxybacillus vitaminiphilus]